MDMLKDLLASQGYECSPTFDGEIQRFTRTKYLSGWFEGYQVQGPNGIIFKARYGDWATGEKHEWSSDAGTTYSKEEIEFLQKQYAELDKKKAEKKKKDQESAAKLAATLWDQAKLAQDDHPYLVRKKIKRHGIRQLAHELVIPIYVEGKLTSLQFIDDKGAKRFLSGGKLKGGVYVLNTPDTADQTEYVAEGFATAASIHEATGKTCIVTFNTAGMVAWAESYGPPSSYDGANNHLVLCADNDQWTVGNPGLTAARKAESILKSKGYRTEVRFPDFDDTPDNRDAKRTDFNDLHVKHGMDAVNKVLTFQAPGQKKRADVVGLPLVQDFTPLPPIFSAKGQPLTPPQFMVVEALQDGFGDVLLREGKDVFLWQGTHWEEQDPNNFKFFVKQVIQRLRSGAAKEGETNDVYNMFLAHLPSSRNSFFQQMPTLSNFQDGTLEIKNANGKPALTFREHRKDDLLTWCLPYSYREPRTPNRLFSDWLHRCFEGDADAVGKIRALAQIGGASLVSLYPRTAFLHGVAGTGKSTFAKLCLAFIGKKNYSSVEPKDQDGFLKETMINKQANIVTDISAAKFDPALLKRYEDRVPELVNRKNKTAVHAYLPALHIYCANKLPKGIDSASEAFDRRVTIVQFNNVVTKGSYQRDYEQAILEAGPGAVLDFFERGLKDLIESGGIYFNPDSGKAALQQWKDSENVVSMFLEAVQHGEIGEPGSKFRIDSDGRVRRSKVTTALATFMGKPPATQTMHAMLQELNDRGYTGRGSLGIRFIYGLSVEGDPEGVVGSKPSSGPGFEPATNSRF